MRIKVVFHGSAKNHSSLDEMYIDLEPFSTVADAVQKIIKLHPSLKKVIKYLFISVNNELVPRNHEVLENDELTLFSRPGGG
jgi:molybdopterin converting factor small subunit